MSSVLGVCALIALPIALTTQRVSALLEVEPDAWAALTPSVLAIIAIVLSLASFALGGLALRHIRRDGSRGHGTAIARTGTALGLVAMVASVSATLYLHRLWERDQPDPEALQAWRKVEHAGGRAICDAASDLCGRGRQRPAEWLLDRAIKRGHEDVDLLFFRAVLFRSRFASERAKDLFEQIATKKPRSWEARCGTCAKRIDDRENANAAFEELLRLAGERPRNPLGFWLAASVARPANRGSEGETAARKVLEIWSPGPAMLHYALASGLELQSRNEEALRHRLIVLETEGDHGYAHDACGRTYVALKRYGEALAEYDKALAIAPHMRDYRLNRDRCLWRMGRVDDAVSDLKKLSAEVPADGEIWNEIGRALEDSKPAEARKLFKKAADLDSGYGMYNYAQMLATGRGGPADQRKAVDWMGRAASNGHVTAWYHFAYWHYEGRGVPRDQKASYALFSEGAERGDTDCLCMMAWQTQRGEGVKRDGPKALALYQRAADRGNAFALYKVGQTYENGWGIPQDPVRAFGIYTTLAKRPTNMRAEALGAAALCHWNGIGTATNRATGLRLFGEAAALKDPWAMCTLGGILAEGRHASQDCARARALLTAAAEKGGRENLNAAAWHFSTATNAALWDADRAIRYARKALGNASNDAPVLDTLAAAYARAGRFEEAVAAQQKAIDLVEKQAKPDAEDARAFRARLAQYERREPYVELPDDT